MPRRASESKTQWWRATSKLMAMKCCSWRIFNLKTVFYTHSFRSLCQPLHRERLALEAYSRDGEAFAERIGTLCGYSAQLRQLLTMMSIMSSIRPETGRREKILVITGESYADRALEHLMAEHLPDYGNVSMIPSVPAQGVLFSAAQLPVAIL